MNEQTYTLANGLRVVYQPSLTEVAYCGYAINAGTRDEAQHQQGMAHFVEHLIFKGTTHRKAWHILNRMEHVGGDLNAYTNKEETVVYAAFLAEHMERAIELLSDIVFHSTFPQREIDKEVEVILDEIASYKDSPSEQIFDDFETMLFQKHALGHNILGLPEQLTQFTTEDALAFTQQYYRPDNMIFFVRGNVDMKRVLRWCEKYSVARPTTSLQHYRDSILPYQPQQLTCALNTYQAHVMLGNRSYKATEEKRTGLYLLNNLLGGPGMNSRLNVALREKRGLVYSVESSLTSYTDTGVFTIYFGTDKKDVAQCLRLVHKELKRLRDQKLTTLQLHMAKKQLIGQIGVASDNFENEAQEMAKVFLHYNKCIDRAEMFKRIEALTASHLLEIANEVLDEQQLSSLLYT
jgi:predicted Zn-dependent peptidase